MLIRRQTRGPPYGWPPLPRPALGQPGTLRAGILAGRRHLFSLAPDHRISSLLTALLRTSRCRPRAHLRSSLLDGRSVAPRSVAALGLPDTCIRRAESSGGLLAISFGGLPRFHGQHILYGRPSSQFCVIFLSVFVIFILDVLAHILIFGSVQFLYASSIYTLFLYACTPTLFPPAFPSCVYSLFSFSVQP
jgi:hypothetical protein